MVKTGILMHVRHLETMEWERLVWGVPEEDSLGSLPKIVELLLNEPADEPVVVIAFGCGPSEKDGLSEGEYTKKFLLDNLHRLEEFPRFAGKIDPDTRKKLGSRLQQIVVSDKISRSIDEVIFAVKTFAKHGITKAYQITSASHAPRCIQIQAAARAEHIIPMSQQWFTVADDRCFEGSEPFSTLIMEPPHRADDPMLQSKPTLPELLRDYQYGLSIDDKRELARIVGNFMKDHVRHSDVRNLAK